MTDRMLKDRRILIVEDEYLLADELTHELEDHGAQVLGPAPNVGRAMALLDGERSPDGAILDVNLGGEAVYPLADALIDRGVPVIFTTGYEPGALPERFARCATCGKPIDLREVTKALGAAIHS